MNIEAQKLQLVQMILETNNPAVLESLKRVFLSNKSTDFWDNLSHELKMEINQGIREIENGETLDYDDFMNGIRK